MLILRVISKTLFQKKIKIWLDIARQISRPPTHTPLKNKGTDFGKKLKTKNRKWEDKATIFACKRYLSWLFPGRWTRLDLQCDHLGPSKTRDIALGQK